MTDEQFRQIYPGWGRAEAEADARAHPEKLGGSTGNYPNSLLSQMGGSIDKYVQDLIDFAGEDYDFVAKWLEKQFTDAMGTDDTARKEFLKSVANELESKIGTIAFDTKTQKYRLQGKTDLALKRLAEDEKTTTEQYNTENALVREQQGSDLNRRGIISGTRENATGLAGKEVGTLETDITRRMDALKRAVGRNTEDINLANTQGLEDITTAARRAAGGAIGQHDYGIENAQRTKERSILDAEGKRKQLKDYLASLEGAVI